MISSLFLQGITLREPPPEDSYLARLPAARWLMGHPLRLNRAVTILAGENGAGKSTLIEAVAVRMGFNAEGGTRNFRFATAETHSPLFRYLDLTRGPYRPEDGFFLRAETFYNAASYLDDIGDARLMRHYGGRSLHEQSHGESFLALVRNRFDSGGFYVLDEPEAALSPASQMELLAHIHRLAEGGSQLLLATHSPILLAFPGACLLWIDEDGIRELDYRQTPHYQITRRFLEDPARMFRQLFEEG